MDALGMTVHSLFLVITIVYGVVGSVTVDILYRKVDPELEAVFLQNQSAMPQILPVLHFDEKSVRCNIGYKILLDEASRIRIGKPFNDEKIQYHCLSLGDPQLNGDYIHFINRKLKFFGTANLLPCRCQFYKDDNKDVESVAMFGLIRVFPALIETWQEVYFLLNVLCAKASNKRATTHFLSNFLQSFGKCDYHNIGLHEIGFYYIVNNSFSALV